MGSEPHPISEAAEAKLRRAFQDLQCLRTKIDEFRKSEPRPFSLAVEFEPGSGWWTARAQVNQEPPPDLGVLVGAIGYQCLSAFNHLVWELAARKIGRRQVWVYKANVQLPIVESQSGFESNTVVNFGPTRGRGMVSKKALAVIEGLQPYKERHGPEGPHEHPLHLIKEIADSDKHRTLTAVLGAVELRALDFLFSPLATNPTFELLINPGDVVAHGTPIGRIRFATGSDKADVRMERQPNFSIQFRTDHWVITLDDIRRMTEWAYQRIQRFAPLFPVR